MQLPLSAAQREIWLAHQFDQGNPHYNCGAYLELAASVDAEALARAVQQAVVESEGLRARFSVNDGVPSLWLTDAVAALQLRDMRGEREPRRAAEEWMRADLGRPVSLVDGPLIAHALLRVSDERCWFYFRHHHILLDGFGEMLHWRRVAELYTALARGAAAPAPEISTLAELLSSEEQYRKSPQHEADRAYWAEVVAEAPSALALGTHVTGEVARDVLFSRVKLPSEVAGQLQRAATARRTYWSVAALAVAGIYLHRLTQAKDVTLGLPVGGRVGRRALATPAMLANELPLQLKLDPDQTFGDVVRQVTSQVGDVLRHQRYRGEDVQRLQRRLHGEAVPPAVVVNVVSFDDHLRFGDLPAVLHPLTSGPVRDLQIELYGGGAGADLEVCFKANAAHTTTEMLAAHQRRFVHLLSAATVASADLPIGQLPMLAASELGWIDAALTGPARDYDLARCLHELVDERARQTPDAIAVETATAQLSFAQLVDAANRLAAELVRRGVTAGQVVGVHDVRSPELVIDLLAVLKAGGAYLPLDPELPRQRLLFQLQDASPRVVLTRARHAAELAEAGVDLLCVDTELARLPAAAAPTPQLTPEHPAYVLYTSGSTGQPKGVVVPHRGVVNRLLWMQEEYRLGVDDVVLQKTPFTFDVSGWEFFWPLLVGCRMFLAEPGLHRDPRYLARIIVERQITTLHFVPPMLELFLAEPSAANVGRLRRVFCSGEALRGETVRGFFARYGDDVELHNLYGPTEASIDVTYWPCRPGDAASGVPIGRPVANTQLYVLDAQGQPTPAGALGELYIGGVQVALGYLNQPALTAERFVEPRPGAGRLYRTGDRVRVRGDGAIEYVGRTDDQVKIRGNRVELGEIESALLGCPGVQQAAVIAPLGADGQRHVLAYAVSPAPLDLAQVTAALRARLPSYMVPAHLVQLAALPMSANGKLDRKALPAPPQGHALADEVAAADAVQDATPPASAAEALVARAWSQVLRVSAPSVDKSFFALGGDSMSAIQIRAELECQGQTFPVERLFEGRTIRELAALLRPVAEVAGAAPKSAPFTLLAPADRAALPGGLDDAYPLSAMQIGMLYHAASTDDSSLYRVVTSLRITGPLDLAALRAAVDDTARRHPALRCSFDLDRYTEPLQLVHRDVTIPVELGDDLGALSAADQRRYLDAWIERSKFTQFELAAAPLLRFVVHPSGRDAFRLSVIEHHVVLDGWSDMRMLEEVVRHYRARLSGQELWLPDVRSTYRDFVAAERRAIANPASREFWKALLRGAEPTLLPRTKPASAPQVRRFDVPIPAAQAAALRAVARREGLPFKALLTAAHLAVLRALGGSDEVVTGVIANARLEEAGGDDVIGVFLNTLPLRLDVGDRSILEAARQVFAAEQAALPHRAYPLGQMQRDLGEELRLDTYVNFMDFHVDRARLAADGMTFEAGVAETNYAVAVDFLIDPERDVLVLWLDCDLGALSVELCERLVGYYQRALAATATTPDARVSELELRGDDELAEIARWNETARPYDPRATVPRLIARQAATTPDAIALVHGFTETSYAELDARANQLAHHLLAQGVRRGDLIGVSVRRSAELVIAMLGVMKAGAAYVPMDPAFPRSRLELIRSDAKLACVITSTEAAREVGEVGDGSRRGVDLTLDRATLSALPAMAPELETDGDDVAYVIYTSGSTGRPKGTGVRHRNVANFFVGMDERVGCDHRDVVVAVTSVSFDISALELLWPLTHGAKVVVTGEGLVTNLVPRASGAARACEFSLFFFAAVASGAAASGGYQLVLDAARFADHHGFQAVWTPERHFHEFGGLYPNPSLMAAALSTITSRVALRSGSVVAPLHDAVRLAEEWSLVDNLSHGRVGLAFASGWNSNDFVLAPARFADRKQYMNAQLADFQRLWRGESLRRVNGTGQEIDVRIFPAPVQAEPPIWLTSVGAIETFERAGALGANVLTHLLGQRPADLEPKIRAYREARAAHGHVGPGQVTLMIHAFLQHDASAAKKRARGPFREYLRSSAELWRTLFAITGQEFPGEAAPEQLDAVVELAIERYFETSGLFGSPDTCAELVRDLADAGVDELACLVDFGVAAAEVVDSLAVVDELRRAHRDEVAEQQHSFTALCARHGVTLLQGTPSLLTAISSEPQALHALRGARALLVGGEAFPAGLAARLADALPATRILNMYGPTETTIWSTTHELTRERDLRGATISIGRPIANTRLQIMDRHGRPVPIGVPGELWIGGEGVAVGYLGQPDLTAERFVDCADEGRFYRTGDRTRWRGDGTVDFLGRMDRQVKILGHRVEPDEIESVLSRHPEIESVAVVARSGANGTELIAYVSPARQLAADPAVEETFVRRWGELWQDTYANADVGAADGEFAGWTSSYDGQPIPAGEMREWLDHTVAQLRALRPRRIVDVGVGVGLILREFAAQAESYHGVDLSAAALAAAERCLGPDRALPAQVQLRRAGPEYLDELPPASVDVVVFNSVVQYFPSIAYLRKALRDAVRVVAPGGAVYVGDVRGVEMLPAFHTAVQLQRAPSLQPLEELRSVISRQLQDERELCISPQFFRDLVDELPELREARVELKRGRADNELTHFRYDAYLLVGEPAPPAPPPPRIAFDEREAGLPWFERQLGAQRGALLVTGVPNRRLQRVTRAGQLLVELPCKATAWELDRQLWEVEDAAALHPEELIALAARHGRTAQVVVPADGRLDRFDVIFSAQEPS